MNHEVDIPGSSTHVFSFGLQTKDGRVHWQTSGLPHEVAVTSFMRGNRDAIIGGPTQPDMFEWEFSAGDVVTAHVTNTSTSVIRVRASVA
jgi:hypothetical protein